MSDKIKDFWNWFEENNHAFLFTNEVEDNVKEKMLEDFINKLHEYNDKLFFQVGGMPGKDQELIITAEGDPEQFESVEKLIKHSPVIKYWIFIPFIQPVDDDNTIRYGNTEITRSDLWFMPLQSQSQLNDIGIRIGVRDYSSLDKNDIDNAVFKMLDTVLGEKSFALDIDYLDIAELPLELEERGWINLMDLRAFIAWKKKKLVG